MRFAHISDLHLCVDPTSNPAVNDNAVLVVEKLANDLSMIADILDFVIISGDLTDDAKPASFTQFEQLFAKINIPVFTVPGNHDGPAAYFGHIETSGLMSQTDISGRMIEYEELRIIGIDTCVETLTTGAIPTEMFDLLERELAGKHSSQLLIVMHHPPFPPGQRDFNEISVLEQVGRFASLVQGAQQPPIILCGHVHRPYVSRWHGANCFIAGSPARLFAADRPFGDAPIQPSDEPYSYFVHQIDRTGHHVMTSRWLDVNDLSACHVASRPLP